MLKSGLLLPLLFAFATIQAQNLVANGGFEDINICTEYNAPCAPEAWFHLSSRKPSATRNLPAAIEGERFEMLLMENFIEPVVKRSFITTPLLCPLQKGIQYELHFSINPARRKEFKIGVCLTREEPKLSDYFLQGHQADLVLTENFRISMEKDGWQKVRATFTATGEEAYLSFGNFDPSLFIISKKEKSRTEIKYLIDEVDLRPLSNSVTPCSELEAQRIRLYAEDRRHTYSPPEQTMAYKDSIVLTDTLPAEFDEEPPSVDSADTPELKFVIPDIGFEFGKFDLNPAIFPLLESCAKQIATITPKEIHILGYTDNVGSEAYNLELSEKRAASIRDWFIEHGLSDTHFVINGLGESNPVANNDSESGRQANRRVEINIIR